MRLSILGMKSKNKLKLPSHTMCEQTFILRLSEGSFMIVVDLETLPKIETSQFYSSD